MVVVVECESLLLFFAAFGGGGRADRHHRYDLLRAGVAVDHRYPCSGLRHALQATAAASCSAFQKDAGVFQVRCGLVIAPTSIIYS